LRILAMAPAGWSYAAIGREEAISRQRAPQTVAQTFDAAESDATPWPRISSGCRELHGEAPPDGSDFANRQDRP